MKRLIPLLLVAFSATGQNDRPLFPNDKEEPKMPDGTSQRQAILKADHKRSVEDSKTLARLAAEVQADIEKGDANLVSLKTIKQLDEMEKLTKAIRARMKRI